MGGQLYAAAPVAMLAARATAASTTPWGEIDVAAAESLLHGDNEEDDFKNKAEIERVVALTHVPLCAVVAKFVRAATSGWALTRHWLHHAAFRKAVHTILLVAERLHRQGKGNAPPAMQGLVLPQLPPELWVLMMRGFRRSDWIIIRANPLN